MNTVNNGIEMVFERKIMSYSSSEKVGDIEIYNNEFYRLQISYMEDYRTFSLNQHYPEKRKKEYANIKLPIINYVLKENKKESIENFKVKLAFDEHLSMDELKNANIGIKVAMETIEEVSKLLK